MADVDYQAIVDQAKKDCTFPSILSDSQPVLGSWTVQKILIVSSATILFLNFLFTTLNITNHLRNYTRPLEQRQIIRILLTPLVFGSFNCFSIAFYDAAYYLQPLADLLEAIALIGLFLLFLAYAIPDTDDTHKLEAYFSSLPRMRNIARKKNANKPKHNRGSLRWFYTCWILSFQILPSRLGITIAIWISHAMGCPLDDHPIAIKALEPIVMMCWLLSIFGLYGRLRSTLRERNAFWKFFIFKFIVIIQVLQEPIFHNLLENGMMTPSKEISYRDSDVGIPAAVVCGEMLVFSIAFFWTFGVREYLPVPIEIDGRPLRTEMGFWKALGHSLDVRDVLRGCLFHGKIAAICGRRRERTVETASDQEDLWRVDAPDLPSYEDASSSRSPGSASTSLPLRHINTGQ